MGDDDGARAASFGEDRIRSECITQMKIRGNRGEFVCINQHMQIIEMQRYIYGMREVIWAPGTENQVGLSGGTAIAANSGA